MLLLWAAGLGAAAQFAKFAVPFAGLQSQYPDAGASLGFMVSLISFLGIVLGLVAGRLVAGFGFRRVLLTALIAGAAISAVQSLFLTLPVMLGLRLIEGLSHLAIVVAAPTLIAEVASDKWRATAMTLWSTFFGVAFALLAWFGLPFVEQHGLEPLLLGHAAYMLIAAVVLWWALPPRGTVHAHSAPVPMVALHLAAYRDRHVTTPALGWISYTLTFAAILTVLPSQIPVESRALVSTLMPLAGLVTAMSLGALLLRFVPAVRVVLWGFILGLAIALALVAMPGSTVLVVALFAAMGLVQGASFAAVPQLNHAIDTRALANGAMAQCGNLGNTLGPPLLLAILPFAGTRGLFVFASLCYVAGIAVYLRAPRSPADAALPQSPMT